MFQRTVFFMLAKREIRLKTWEMALLLGVAIALFATSWASCRQQELETRVVRLHVLANSDSAEDQALKLDVRDAVLAQASMYLTHCHSTQQAKAILRQRLQPLADTAAQTIAQKGYDYAVKVSLERTYFPTKVYADFALPAGAYQGLRVEIGRAEGHNWWCVVFPPLCFSSVSEQSEAALRSGLTEDDLALLTGEDQGYVFRFQCLEWFGQLKQWLGHG